MGTLDPIEPTLPLTARVKKVNIFLGQAVNYSGTHPQPARSTVMTGTCPLSLATSLFARHSRAFDLPPSRKWISLLDLTNGGRGRGGLTTPWGWLDPPFGRTGQNLWELTPTWPSWGPGPLFWHVPVAIAIRGHHADCDFFHRQYCSLLSCPWRIIATVLLLTFAVIRTSWLRFQFTRHIPSIIPFNYLLFFHNHYVGRAQHTT